MKPDDSVAMQRRRSKAKPSKLSSSVCGAALRHRAHMTGSVFVNVDGHSQCSFARVVRAWILNAFVVNNV